MRIGIVTKPDLADARQTLIALETWLRERGIDTLWSSEAAPLLPDGNRAVTDRARMPAAVDLVLVLGGDGTLLAMADLIAAAERDIPILGVNFGSLGFLTEITRPELFASLDAILQGRAALDERMMLRARVTPAGIGGAAAGPARQGREAQARDAEMRTVTELSVLNDVVFSRTALSRMIDMSVWVGEQFVTTVRADGLIIASPTGSTAYNLSAGGPIVHPAMDALLITPIAPHTLSNRPIVIPTGREVRIEPGSPNAGDEIYVTFDGQRGFPLHPGDSVTIGRAARPLRLIRASTRSYFEVLREKLKWNVK